MNKIVGLDGEPVAPKKKVVLCTLPGSGTHFFKKLLEDHGFEVKAFHCSFHGVEKANWIMNDEANVVLVTTYRNIDMLYQNWDDNKEHRQLDKLEYLEGFYRLMAADPVIVSFDNCRDARLAFLSHCLDMEAPGLVTDWEPINPTPADQERMDSDARH